MKNNSLKLLALAAAFGMSSCTAYKANLEDYKALPVSGAVMQKAQNFVVLLDGSSSMTADHMGYSRILQAKTFVKRMNNTLPALKYNAALRASGNGNQMFNKEKSLVYGWTAWNGEEMNTSVGKIDSTGGSHIADSLSATNVELTNLKGHTAIIVVGDGEDIGDAVDVSSNIKKAYGDRVCIHTVLVGDSENGKKAMTQVAKASGCGVAKTLDEVNSPENMSEFVKTAFLEKDTDKDGVVDSMDKCPGTPAGTKVDASGCNLDADKDGVIDDNDKCPNTPAGAKVDANGCSASNDADGDGVLDAKDQCPNTPKGVKVDARGCWSLKKVHFASGKSEIKPNFFGILDEVVNVLKQNKFKQVVVAGHTDNKGSAPKNQSLSESRANAIVDYLVSKGIAKDSLKAVGYGSSKSADTNDTEAGRSNNRRIELSLIP